MEATGRLGAASLIKTGFLHRSCDPKLLGDTTAVGTTDHTAQCPHPAAKSSCCGRQWPAMVRGGCIQHVTSPLPLDHPLHVRTHPAPRNLLLCACCDCAVSAAEGRGLEAVRGDALLQAHPSTACSAAEFFSQLRSRVSAAAAQGGSSDRLVAVLAAGVACLEAFMQCSLCGCVVHIVLPRLCAQQALHPWSPHLADGANWRLSTAHHTQASQQQRRRLHHAPVAAACRARSS
jgi:hypothetical protein